LRQRLAEHYRTSHEELAAQKEELTRLAVRLDQQQQRLVEQRQQLRTWLATQQQDIECQAARLVAREQELDQQEQAMRVQEARWQQERPALQQQLRELLARSRGAELLEA